MNKKAFLRVFFSLAAFAGFPNCVQASELKIDEVQVGAGRRLVTYTQLASPRAPWLVYMPGSGDNLKVMADLEPLQILLRKKSHNLLVIHKVGVELNGKVASQDDFQKGSIRSQRIADNLLVMKRLIPAQADILLVAMSEGAYISPEVALADARIKSMILLSGNTWSWLEEEVMFLPENERQKLRDFLEKEVLPNPVFDKFYGGFWSYAYFDSYHTDLTFTSLQKLTIPILAINGAEDEVLWLDGAIQNMHKLIEVEKKSNMQFHLLAGANHGLRCPDGDLKCNQAAMSLKLEKVLSRFL